MKRVVFVLIACLSLVFSCKKDNALSGNNIPGGNSNPGGNNNPGSNSNSQNDKIAGKWSVVSTVDSLYQNSSGLATSSYTGDSTDYIDFKKDGNQYSRLNQSLNVVPYKMLDEQTVLIDSDTFQVKTMTSNSISLYNRISYSDGWYASLLNLKK